MSKSSLITLVSYLAFSVLSGAEFGFSHAALPFTIPPGVSLRFELAFDAQGTATALRFRGFESEAVLNFSPR